MHNIKDVLRILNKTGLQLSLAFRIAINGYKSEIQTYQQFIDDNKKVLIKYLLMRDFSHKFISEKFDVLKLKKSENLNTPLIQAILEEAVILTSSENILESLTAMILLNILDVHEHDESSKIIMNLIRAHVECCKPLLAYRFKEIENSVRICPYANKQQKGSIENDKES